MCPFIISFFTAWRLCKLKEEKNKQISTQFKICTQYYFIVIQNIYVNIDEGNCTNCIRSDISLIDTEVFY